MLVKEIMQKDIGTCRPTEDLACASRVMQEHNCGFIPVVDSAGKVAGVVTDRDICLAIGLSKQRAPSHVPLAERMSHPVYSCLAGDNVKVALAAMANHHVRRLPVIDEEGHLQGVLSLDDIARVPYGRGTPTAEDIVFVLKAALPPRAIQEA